VPVRSSRDLLSLKLNPTGYLAASGAVYAAAAMIYNAHFHHGVLSTPVLLAAIGAVAGLLIHTQVTPVAAPRDGNGNLLVPAPLSAVQAAVVPPAPLLVPRLPDSAYPPGAVPLDTSGVPPDEEPQVPAG